MTGRQITSAELSIAQVADVLALAGAARQADDVEPLSEHVMLHLRYDRPDPDPGPSPDPEPVRDFILAADGEIAGYAYLDPPPANPESDVSGELVIHPGRRRQGFGRALVGELAAEAGGHTLRLWAHGDLPAAAALAGTTGFERFRALWQMRRPLAGLPGRPALPPGRTLRTFVPGQDEDEWLNLNGRAFAKHPEQGGWRRHDLELREREPWFDPAGFFIAEADGLMTGFHWTKVHPPGDWTKVHPPGEQSGSPYPGAPPSPGIGEVYVVGVDPAEQGSGLGRALTLAGLHHLRDLGVAQAMLYVDEDNVPAIKMYEALGFTRARIDVMYRKRALAMLAVLAWGTTPRNPRVWGAARPPCPPAIPPGPPRLAAGDSQRLVEFRGRQRPVRGRHRAQHLGVELDFIKGDAVVDTKIQLPGNRAHLRR